MNVVLLSVNPNRKFYDNVNFGDKKKTFFLDRTKRFGDRFIKIAKAEGKRKRAEFNAKSGWGTPRGGNYYLGNSDDNFLSLSL